MIDDSSFQLRLTNFEAAQMKVYPFYEIDYTLISVNSQRLTDGVNCYSRRRCDGKNHLDSPLENVVYGRQKFIRVALLLDPFVSYLNVASNNIRLLFAYSAERADVRFVRNLDATSPPQVEVLKWHSQRTSEKCGFRHIRKWFRSRERETWVLGPNSEWAFYCARMYALKRTHAHAHASHIRRTAHLYIAFHFRRYAAMSFAICRFGCCHHFQSIREMNVIHSAEL